MQVVINTCYGGFGLSTKAMKELIKRECKAVRIMTEKAYRGSSSYRETLKDAGDGYMVGHIEDVLYKDGNVYIYDDGNRTDSDLIVVVESLGEKASGHLGKLKIVEIPDGIDWSIDEYDGIEHIAENHRTWG